jgi:hypothetical protein
MVMYFKVFALFDKSEGFFFDHGFNSFWDGSLEFLFVFFICAVMVLPDLVILSFEYFYIAVCLG